MSDLPPDPDTDAPRPRSMTSLCLTWLAERMRRAERIRAQVSDGSYRVSSEAVAQAMLNNDPPP